MPRKLTREEFIARAKAKHGERYDYSQVVYSKAHDRVTVVCPDHGPFKQKAYQHLNYGCAKCSAKTQGDRARTTVEDFIARACEIHNARYDYSRVMFNTQHELVEIGCPVHGWFEQAANDHLKGRGCRRCGSERSAESRRGSGMSTADFVARARRVHGDRYDYSLTRFSGWKEKLSITCVEHGTFEQFPGNHLAQMGCRICGTQEQRVTLDEFVSRSKAVHGGRYDVVAFDGYDKPVGFICPDHGYFEQMGPDHLDGHKCALCAKEANAEILRYTAAEFAGMLRGKFADAVTFDDNDYVDLKTAIPFTCIAHGTSERTPTSALASTHPCPECGVLARALQKRLTQEEFEERARKTHDVEYRYGTFSGSANPIEIFCPKHGTFIQNAGNHLAGYGCPTCGARKRKSQNQWLDTMGITSREVWLKVGDVRMNVDGYDEATKTVYEFWGDFWHGNPQVYDPADVNTATGTTFGSLYEKTMTKRKNIIAAGYQLVEIWEHDWERINGKKNL